MSEKILFYDLETYRNFFSAVFCDNDGGEWTFCKYNIAGLPKVDELHAMVKFIVDGNYTLVGYNSVSFDDIILNVILSRPNIGVLQIWDLAQMIIRGSYQDANEVKYATLDRLELEYGRKHLYESIDLIQQRANRTEIVSLKSVSVGLHWVDIRDLPIHYDKKITAKDLDLMLSYNLNDVLITRRLYYEVLDRIELRQGITGEYGVNVVNKNRSDMASALLRKMYSEATGKPYREFKDDRTHRTVFHLSAAAAHLAGRVRYDDEAVAAELRAFLLNKVDSATNFKFAKSVAYRGTEYTFGVGGLHTVDRPGIFKSDDEYVIRDCDVASYYPNMMIEYGIRPEHLGDIFLELYTQIKDDRIAAKRRRKEHPSFELKNQALKIVINSVFGKMGSKFSWLYDPLALLKVTVGGQLLLFDLCEKLENAGFKVLSANTDGVVSRVERSREDEYMAICDDWQKRTSLELEYTDYSEYMRTNVNSYVVIKPGDRDKQALMDELRGVCNDNDVLYYMADELVLRGMDHPVVDAWIKDKPIKKKHHWTGNVKNAKYVHAYGVYKSKGQFVTDINFDKGYAAPIIAKAVKSYIVDNVDPSEFIRSFKDPYQFCFAQKVRKDFTVYTQRMVGGVVVNQPTQRTNRYAVVYKGRGGSVILKTQDGSPENMSRNAPLGSKSLLKGHEVIVANHLDVDDYDRFFSMVNYDYYIQKAQERIDDIIWHNHNASLRSKSGNKRNGAKLKNPGQLSMF